MPGQSPYRENNRSHLWDPCLGPLSKQGNLKSICSKAVPLRLFFSKGKGGGGRQWAVRERAQAGRWHQATGPSESRQTFTSVS